MWFSSEIINGVETPTSENMELSRVMAIQLRDMSQSHDLEDKDFQDLFRRCKEELKKYHGVADELTEKGLADHTEDLHLVAAELEKAIKSVSELMGLLSDGETMAKQPKRPKKHKKKKRAADVETKAPPDDFANWDISNPSPSSGIDKSLGSKSFFGDLQFDKPFNEQTDDAPSESKNDRRKHSLKKSKSVVSKSNDMFEWQGASQDTVNQLQAKCDELTKNCADVEMQNQTLQQQLNQSLKLVEEFKSKFNDTEKRYDESNAKNTKLRNENDQLSEDYLKLKKNLQSELDFQTTESKRYKDQAESSRADMEQANARVEIQRKDCDKLTNDIKESKDVILNLQSELHNMAAQNRSLRGRASYLEHIFRLSGIKLPSADSFPFAAALSSFGRSLLTTDNPSQTLQTGPVNNMHVNGAHQNFSQSQFEKHLRVSSNDELASSLPQITAVTSKALKADVFNKERVFVSAREKQPDSFSTFSDLNEEIDWSSIRIVTVPTPWPNTNHIEDLERKIPNLRSWYRSCVMGRNNLLYCDNAIKINISNSTSDLTSQFVLETTCLTCPGFDLKILFPTQSANFGCALKAEDEEYHSVRTGQTAKSKGTILAKSPFTRVPYVTFVYSLPDGLVKEFTLRMPVPCAMFLEPIEMTTSEFLRLWDSPEAQTSTLQFALNLREELAVYGGFHELHECMKLQGRVSLLLTDNRNGRNIMAAGRFPKSKTFVQFRIEFGQSYQHRDMICITIRSNNTLLAQSLQETLIDMLGKFEVDTAQERAINDLVQLTALPRTSTQSYTHHKTHYRIPVLASTWKVR